MKTFDEIMAERKKKKGVISENSSNTRKSFDEIMAERKGISSELNLPSSTKTVSSGPAKTDNRKWFQKGAFEDGYQFGDLLKTIGASFTDASGNAGSGVIGIGETIVDTLLAVGNILSGQQINQNAQNELMFNVVTGKETNNVLEKYDKWQKEAKKATEEFIKQDLYDEKAVANKIITEPLEKLFDVDAEKGSIFGEKSDELIQSGGQLLATAGLQAAGVPWWLTTGLTTFGAETENALNQGATFEEATLSGLVSAGAEILTEKISGGIKFGGKTLDDALTKRLAANVSNKVARTLAKFGMDTVFEGAEEVLSGVMSAIGQKLTYADDKELNELFSSEDAWDSFIGGAVLGGFSSAGNAVKSNVTGVDALSGLTTNEKAVFDKVYKDTITEREKGGEKLTAKEKTKIYDDVLNKLEKGYISTDTIESVLGGETYKQYQTEVDNEKALQDEFNTLNKMKQGDMTGEQQDRRDELKEQLKAIKEGTTISDLKHKLSTEVSELAKNSRLMESYNEKSRKGKAFEADLSQYDEKQRSAVKRAIDSGILNNTNRTHEFVDLIAKLEADKGVLFDFTNNEKLKSSMFSVEGKEVAGYVKGKNIAINIDSSKALNTVVGHEITHILEGTELYPALQDVVKVFAESKGEYNSKLQSITKLYDGIEGANIENELTAELIGEYLFSDTDFIKNLSAEQPGLFQKIYDEVKYLCKVATTGSKELRQLEKVKKTFAEVYRQKNNTVTDNGVKYSITNKADDSKAVVRIINENISKISNESHFSVASEKLPDGIKPSDYIFNIFTKQGGVAINDELGTVELSRSGAKSTALHGFGNNKLAAVKAIQNVIEKGNVINKTVNYNGTDVDRYTIAAKGTIDGKSAIVGVVVKAYPKNKSSNAKFYLHEAIITETDSPFRTAPQLSVDTVSESVSNNSIFNSSENVKENDTKYSLVDGSTDIAPEMNNNIYGEDIKLEIDDVPIKETTEATDNTELDIPDLFVEPKNIENEQTAVSDDVASVEQSAETVETIDEKAVIRLTGKVIDGLDIGKTKKNKTAIGEVVKFFGDNYSTTSKDVLYDAIKEKFETIYVDSVIKNMTDLIYEKVTEHREATSKVEKVTKDIESANISDKVKNEIKNQLTSAYEKIEAEFNIDKENLIAEMEAHKNNLINDTSDKSAYIKKNANELYTESTQMEKGKRVTPELGLLLDTIKASYPDLTKNEIYRTLRTTLLNIRNRPDSMVNVNSEIEKFARELINDNFDSAVEELKNFDNISNEELSKLEEKAEERRYNAKLAVNGKLVREIMDAEQVSMMGDTSLWKDKSKGFMYKTETEHRNFRDIVKDKNGKSDVKKADALYDYFMGTYNHNEAELKREAAVIQKKFADLKLNKYEDVFVQMKGEFLHNPHTELTQHDIDTFLKLHGKKINESKVDNAIDMARETYDSLIERMNEVLVAHGMKPIEYRKGYFPHFSEVEKTKWQKIAEKFLNWKTRNDDIPTDIAGMTESFKPNRSWQSFNKQRIGDETDYSFMKGFDGYLQGSLDWIHHIDDIMKRRVFENRIRYDHSDEGVKKQIQEIYKNNEFDTNAKQEQIDLVFKEAKNPLNNFIIDFRTRTNTLAGKKSSMDRGMEEFTNRKFYSTVTNISNRVTGNMVAGSISSALTNFIPITQSWGEVSPASSLKAMGETIKSTFKDDGTINKSDFLTNRLTNVEKLYQTGWDKANKVAGSLMEAIDRFTSQTVWRSKYLENMSKGMSETEAIKNADEFAENLIAGRSRGNMPTIFDSKNPLIKAVTAFQLEVNNQYRYMFKDMPQDLKNESIGKLVKGYATMFIGAYAYNAAYSLLTGRDAAFDPIRIIQELIGDLTDEEDEPIDIIMDLTDNVLEELPFVGGLLGGGRIPISSALPYGDGIYEAFEGTMTDLSEGDFENLTKEWLLSAGAYVLSPTAGGQIKKTIQGLSMFDDDLPIAGSYTDSGNLRFTVDKTMGEMVKAGLFGQYSSKTARQYFDEERTPLSDKKTQELIDLDIPIEQYWEYQDGIKALGTDASLEEKVDYIANLAGYSTEQKNIMANNLTDRKTPIDLTDYDEYRSLDALDYASENPEKYLIAKAVGGYDSYKGYSDDLYDIKADKDKNGKSISGSRKEKVIEYVNNLDIDYGPKLILFKSQYKSDDRYNSEIVDYLNSREDITRDEIITILKELDFTVYDDGTVRW